MKLAAFLEGFSLKQEFSKI